MSGKCDLIVRMSCLLMSASLMTYIRVMKQTLFFRKKNGLRSKMSLFSACPRCRTITNIKVRKSSTPTVDLPARTERATLEQRGATLANSLLDNYRNVRGCFFFFAR